MSDEESDGVRSLDDRHIQFYAPVNRTTVAEFNRLLHVLSRSLTRQDTITVFLQSCGGDVGCAFSAVDHMRNCRVPVHTVIDGEVCSAATIIATGGTKRSILPNATVLIHQLHTTAEGTASAIMDTARHCRHTMRQMKRHYLRHCPHLTRQRLHRLLRHDTVLSAKKCIRYGIAERLYR
jgi:ATP-dependent Clp protease protease subunit